MVSLKDLLHTFLSGRCVDLYLVHHDYLNVSCFKAGLSRTLGYGIIVGSSLVKIPQVLKILKNQSAAGLSILSILLELLTFTTAFSYSLAMGYPFSSYGESAFLAIQTFIICWMAINWEISFVSGLSFAAAYGAVLAATVSSFTPLSLLYALQTANVPVMLSSKILQIFANWRNASTGQLSAITVILFAVGSSARIFTSIQETGDGLIILTFVLSTLCNYILLAQLLYYWKSPLRSDKKNK